MVYLQKFASVVVAKKAVGGAVKGHDAHDLSNHLNQFVTKSTSQYKSLFNLYHSIHARVAANLAMAKGK